MLGALRYEVNVSRAGAFISTNVRNICPCQIGCVFLTKMQSNYYCGFHFFLQVVLCKFHSVFLSQKGQVFTCGHGQGGRLGHGDEQTYLVRI